MKPVTIQLREPIKFGSQVIVELTLRAPKAKDFRQMPNEPTTSDILDLVGQLSAQPKIVIDELGVEDMMEVVALVQGFLPASPPTGGKPSPS